MSNSAILTREEVSLLGTVGIISGYEDGTFKPNNSITREEASMLLYKTAQYMGITISMRITNCQIISMPMMKK